MRISLLLLLASVSVSLAATDIVPNPLDKGNLGASTNAFPHVYAVTYHGSGSNLTDIVTSTGTNLTGWSQIPTNTLSSYWQVEANQVNVKDAPYGALGDGVTDDTAAFQRAIDYLFTNNLSGTVWVPDGDYVFNGEYRLVPGTTDAYAQLIFPVRNPDLENTNYAAVPYIVVRLCGFNPPPHSTVLNTNGAIIRSTRVPTQTNSFIIGCSGSIVGTAWGFNGIHPWIENLIIRTGQDPKQHAIDISAFGQATLKNLWIDTGVTWTNLLTAETTNLSYGVKMPRVLNNVIVSITDVDVLGFHTGFKLSEFAAPNRCRAWVCSVGFELGNSMAAISGQNLLAFWCRTNILATDTCYINFSDFEWENASASRGPAWATTNHWDLWQPTNYVHGIINVAGITAGGVPSNFKRPIYANDALEVKNIWYNADYLPLQIGSVPGIATDPNLPIVGRDDKYALPGLFRRSNANLSASDPGNYLSMLCPSNGIYFLSYTNWATWGRISVNGFRGGVTIVSNSASPPVVTAPDICTWNSNGLSLWMISATATNFISGTAP